MKDFKLLLKNWGFWVVIYSFLITIVLIVVSMKLWQASHETNAVTSDFYAYKIRVQKEKQELTNKIHSYEIKIKEIDSFVDAMSDDELDNEYSRIFAK